MMYRWVINNRFVTFPFNTIVFIVFVILLASCALQGSQFNPHVLQALKLPNLLVARAVHDAKNKDAENILQNSDPLSCSTVISYENAHRCINVAAILFASLKIYKRYTLVVPDTPSAMMQSWLFKLCPQWLSTLQHQGSFFVDALVIICEALSYKTIAKCVVACGTHDIVDAAEVTVERGQQLATKIVWE